MRAARQALLAHFFPNPNPNPKPNPDPYPNPSPNPSQALLAHFFQAEPHSRAIVFVSRRATVSSVCAHLAHAARTGECPHARAAPFVGRGTRAEAVGAGAAGMAQAEP